MAKRLGRRPQGVGILFRAAPFEDGWPIVEKDSPTPEKGHATY
jgi:hypothetical protein